MKSILVGVIGHVDHGKSALVRALTGIDTDRLKEEKERGISIVLGFSMLRVPGGEIDLVDMPGHERFVRAMIAGATGIEAVLLAVAANEGVKPQTREHLAIARLIGIRRGVVALTKCELVPPEVLADRMEEVRRLAVAAGLEHPAVIPTSVIDGRGVAELSLALACLLDRPASRADDGFAYLPIDRAFAVPGFGPVVTGTLRRGGLAVGDELEVMPGGLRARVRGLQVHGRTLRRVDPGRRTAVNLRGVEIGQLARGLALVSPGALQLHAWLDVALAVTADAPRALVSGERLRLLFGTSEVGARLRLLDRDTLGPGGETVAQLTCAEPIAVPAREPFLLRFEAPALTVAGGRVLDPAAKRRRRFDDAVLSALRTAAEGRPARTLLKRLELAGPAGVELDDLARLLGTGADRVRRRLAELGARPAGGARVTHPECWARLRSELLDALQSHHGDHPLDFGLAKEALLALLPSATHPAIGDALVRELVAGGTLVHDRGVFRRADFNPAGHEQDATRDLEATFRAAGLMPPDEAEMARRDGRYREALRYLTLKGALVRAVDRVQGRSILFHRDAVDQAKDAIASALASRDGFLAREAGALLGISRKFSIPLLEHLDAIGFTRRQGDRRVVVGQSRPGPSRIEAR